MDPRRAPEWVGDGHLPDQAADVGADLRAAAARTRLAGPVPGEAATMPGDDRRGSDDHQGRFPVGPCPSKSKPEQPVGPAHGGLRGGAPVNSQLLPQREVLENQTAVWARQNDQQPDNVDDPGDHNPAYPGTAQTAEGAWIRARLRFGERQPLGMRLSTA